MYLAVGLQMLILSVMVGSEELNRAWDSGASVRLEIVQARARKDPFRGAAIFGRSALDLDGATATVPSERLQPGERVRVFFDAEESRRPRITRVERRARKAPPFTSTSFSLAGRVLETEGHGRYAPGPSGELVAHAGKPAVAIALELPDSIPVDDAALSRLTGPSVVRASLHHGVFGRPYFTDVRLIGRSFPYDVSFFVDDARGRLVVLAPREGSYRDSGLGGVTDPPRSDVFFFDGLGQERGSIEVVGRLIEAIPDPEDGALLALVSEQRWGGGEVSLARIRDDGQIAQRTAPILPDRIVGFERSTGSAWVLTGNASPERPPHFVERVAVGGIHAPRLGPFASRPHMVVSSDEQVWVVETDQHRITRLSLPSGRVLGTYADLNRPTHIAVDPTSLYVVEANGSQLAKLGADGRVAWRVPRFDGIQWIAADSGAGGGWLGATAFNGKSGGLFRFGSDGSITPAAAGLRFPGSSQGRRSRVGIDVARPGEARRLYIANGDGIEIIGPDGSHVARVDGFRFAQEQPLR